MDEVKILLVDDEREFLSVLAERLQIRGYRVESVSDGEAALDLIEVNPPDVVVLDLILPGLNGLEILRRIKVEKPDTPVILLTGQGSTQEGIEGMRLGAFDFLFKPVDITELIEKIEDAAKNL